MPGQGGMNGRYPAMRSTGMVRIYATIPRNRSRPSAARLKGFRLCGRYGRHGLGRESAWGGSVGIWRRFRLWQVEVQRRGSTDHPWGFPSQQELEDAAGYTPGGVNLQHLGPVSEGPAPDERPGKQASHRLRGRRTARRPSPSTRFEHVTLWLALAALVLGFVLRITGIQWGLIVMWIATAVGIGVLVYQRAHGRL